MSESLPKQDFIRGPFALVSPDKDRFIIWAAVRRIPYIVSFFDVTENGVQPSLSFDINRLFRAKKMLKRQPNLFILKSDGKKLEIDAVHKLISFNQPASGIIQYHLTDEQNLKFEVDKVYTRVLNSEPWYVAVKETDDTAEIPDKLQVIPLMMYNGFMISIADSVEKVLYMTINEKESGFLGFTEQHEFRRITALQKMWPELDLTFSVKDGKCSINSDLVKDYINADKCVLAIQRNFGSSDLGVKQLFTF